MQTSLAVANFFIIKSIQTGIEVTPMKLVKLVYISHGWYLGYTGEPLIGESIQAWKYGPVVPSIYNEFKRYKDCQIDSPAHEIIVGPDGDPFFYFPTVQGDDEVKLLENVWQAHKSFTGIELSALTHQKNTPWDITWNKRNGKNKWAEIIPNDIIEEHYKAKINANNSQSPSIA